MNRVTTNRLGEWSRLCLLVGVAWLGGCRSGSATGGSSSALSTGSEAHAESRSGSPTDDPILSGGPCGADTAAAGIALSDTAPAGVALEILGSVRNRGVALCPGDGLVEGDTFDFELRAHVPLVVHAIAVGSDGEVLSLTEPPGRRLGAGESLGLPDPGQYLQITGDSGTEVVVFIASVGSLDTSDPALAALVRSAHAGRGDAAALRALQRGNLRAEGAAHRVDAVPDTRGVLAIAYPVKHSDVHTRSVVLLESVGRPERP